MVDNVVSNASINFFYVQVTKGTFLNLWGVDYLAVDHKNYKFGCHFERVQRTLQL